MVSGTAETRTERFSHLEKRAELLKIVSFNNLKRAYDEFKDKKTYKKYHKIAYEALRLDGYRPNEAGKIAKELCGNMMVNVIRGMFNYYKDVA